MTTPILAAAGKEPKAAAPSEPKRAHPPIKWANEAAALELYEYCLRKAEEDLAAETAANAAARVAAERSAA